jgi:hypothetical protein
MPDDASTLSTRRSTPAIPSGTGACIRAQRRRHLPPRRPSLPPPNAGRPRSAEGPLSARPAAGPTVSARSPSAAIRHTASKTTTTGTHALPMNLRSMSRSPPSRLLEERGDGDRRPAGPIDAEPRGLAVLQPHELPARTCAASDRLYPEGASRLSESGSLTVNGMSRSWSSVPGPPVTVRVVVS